MVTSQYRPQLRSVRQTTTLWTSTCGRNWARISWSSPTSIIGSLAKREPEVWWNSGKEFYSVKSSRMSHHNVMALFPTSLSSTPLATRVVCPWALIWFVPWATCDWRNIITLMETLAPTGLPMILVALTPWITSKMSLILMEIFTSGNDGRSQYEIDDGSVFHLVAWFNGGNGVYELGDIMKMLIKMIYLGKLLVCYIFSYYISCVDISVIKP